MRDSNEWEMQEAGWYTHPKYGGVCREKPKHWTAHPISGQTMTFKTMREAREYCEEEFQMTSLFDLPESLSPRLAWMRQHKISLYKTPALDVGQEDHWGNTMGEWGASHEKLPSWHTIYIGYGNEENDALIDLAKKMKIPPWNEPAKEGEA